MCIRDSISPFDSGLLTDRQGKLIAHSYPSQTASESPLSAPPPPLLREQMPVGNEVKFLRWRDPADTEWLGFTYRLESGWQLMLQRRLTSVAAEYAGALWQTCLLYTSRCV